MDATDRLRVGDCQKELASLLREEVKIRPLEAAHPLMSFFKRLMGASLLVFCNKIDVDGCMTDDEIRQVCLP